MEYEDFVDRAFAHLPSRSPTRFQFASWKHGGRVTAEGVGIMPIPGLEPDKLIAAVSDLDHYVGNVDHVAECRTVSDSRFEAPSQRFYQRVSIPVLGAVHHELVMHQMPDREGFKIAAWEVLRAETDALNPKLGFRSDYNLGAWIAAPGVLGYALCSAPKRKDVGMLKWKVLTKGADAAASKVLEANLRGMAAWAARR